jgi:hypothetical protein
VSYLNSPFECGVCGRKLPASAIVCSGCGADEKTGLREDTWDTDASSELGIIDEEGFDYDEFIKEEFDQDGETKKRRFLHPVWIIVGVLLVIAMAYAALRF